jgi:large subunit ribosomal protein L24
MNIKPKLNKKMRKGDKVVAIAGNFRGQTGTVLSRDGEKVIVQGLNIRKKHVKGSKTSPGRILELEKPIHVSNLMVCAGEDKPVKLKIRQNKKGHRELFYKEGDNEVLYRSVKSL